MSSSAKPGKQTVKVHDLTNSRFYYLESGAPLASGGEAFIYAVRDEPGLLAKVYKQRNAETAEKLAVMLTHRPKNPTERLGHECYAWPTALLAGPNDSAVIGFLMPKIAGMRAVFDFYNPGQRRTYCPSFNYRYLHQTARNLAGIMHEVHSTGYVVGDVNQKNIYVSDKTMVTLLDTDSFQIRDPNTKRIYLCRVQTDGFIAPELFRTGRKGVERSVDQDLFGLAVVIFHLLMEGVHPFNGVDPSPGEPRNAQQRIVSGELPYAPGSNLLPMPIAPPFDILHPELRALFLRCFVDGHHDSTARPAAKQWQQALHRASKDLQSCNVNDQHFFGSHLNACPWCERVSRKFNDSFPRKSMIRSRPQTATTRSTTATRPGSPSPIPVQISYQPIEKNRIGPVIWGLLAFLVILALAGAHCGA